MDEVGEQRRQGLIVSFLGLDWHFTDKIVIRDTLQLIDKEVKSHPTRPITLESKEVRSMSRKCMRFNGGRGGEL